MTTNDNDDRWLHRNPDDLTMLYEDEKFQEVLDALDRLWEQQDSGFSTDRTLDEEKSF